MHTNALLILSCLHLFNILILGIKGFPPKPAGDFLTKQGKWDALYKPEAQSFKRLLRGELILQLENVAFLLSPTFYSGKRLTHIKMVDRHKHTYAKLTCLSTRKLFQLTDNKRSHVRKCQIEKIIVGGSSHVLVGQNDYAGCYISKHASDEN